MLTLFSEREIVAKQLLPNVVSSLSEFASKKWAGGCLSGRSAKFRIYYLDGTESNIRDGHFRWIVHSENGKVLEGGDREYPAYAVVLEFEDETATPKNLSVRYDGGYTKAVSVSEADLKQLLMEVLTKGHKPIKEYSWHFEEWGEGKRLK
jgi:hypothetical protein